MQRRSFLIRATLFVQGLIGALIAIPALRFLLDPLRRRRTASRFIRVAPLSAIAEGKPARIVVSTDRWDGYTHHPPGPVGSVWLIRDPAPNTTTGDPAIRCLQTICPHLGCPIAYLADRGSFSCPCHASDFDRNGGRVSGPSPRDMDELPCRITDPDELGRRWVEVAYQVFQTGVPDKRPMA